MSIVASASEDENPEEIPSSEPESRGRDFGNSRLSNRQGVGEGRGAALVGACPRLIGHEGVGQ